MEQAEPARNGTKYVIAEVTKARLEELSIAASMGRRSIAEEIGMRLERLVAYEAEAVGYRVIAGQRGIAGG